jgi:predicted homoserine dehydrogenase-like protein
LGLAHEVKLRRDIAEGQSLKWSDVLYDAEAPAARVRREMEALFGGAGSDQGADQRRQ